MTRMTELRQSMILFFRVIVCAAFLLMMAELLSSCEHKDLCYDHPHRETVEVTFDWSEARDANPATMSLSDTSLRIRKAEPSLRMLESIVPSV